MWSISVEKKIALGQGSSPVTPTLRRLRQKDQNFGSNHSETGSRKKETDTHRQENAILLHVFIVCVQAHMWGGVTSGHMCATALMRRSEDNVQDHVVSFHYVGPGD